MNKLLFSEGGQPLNLDDLEFMQTSTIDAIKALASPWGNCVLAKEWHTGAHTGGSIFVWDECMVSINGEIAYLPASELNMSAIYTSDAHKVYIQLSSREDNVKNFADGSQHPTRKLYRAEMKVGIPPIDSDVIPVVGKKVKVSDYLLGDKIKEWLRMNEREVKVSNVKEGVSVRLRIKDLGGFNGLKVLYGRVSTSQSIERFDGYICELEGGIGDDWYTTLQGDSLSSNEIYFARAISRMSSDSIQKTTELRILDSSGQAPSRLLAGTYSFQCILP